MRTGLVRGALALAVVIGVAGLVAQPAASDAGAPAAAARLEVQAGLPEGSFLPGRPMPVRVRVSSDRLLKGDLHVEVKGFGGGVPTVLPVEVAGGNPKVFTVVLLTAPAEDRLEVVASLQGARAEAKATRAEDMELVGLLPGVTEETPAQVPMAMDMGTMRFVQLDEALLGTPGSVGPLGTIVAGPDGLAGFDGAALANVLGWVENGGHLVVDAAVGDPLEGLPEAWQPGESGRVTAGRGQVRAVGGAVARGRWADVVKPTTLVEWLDPMSRGGFFGDNEVSYSLAKGSGLKLPDATWLIVFLVVYVLVVGPLAFIVVRRSQRLRNVAWVAIGGLAAVFTAGAFVGGRDIRSNTRAAHASYIETGVSGTNAYSYFGLISPSGTDPRVAMPAGWTASSYASPWGGDVRTSGLTAVELGSDGVSGRMGLEAGGFGLMVGSGPVAGPAQGLAVTATAAADGSVSGTVRNTTEVELRRVLVLVGRRTWEGPDLAPGEEAEWRLEKGEGRVGDGGPPETAWFDWNRNVPEDPDVDFALWSQVLLRQLDPYPPGWAVAAGWTDEWSPPVTVGDKLEGKTVFTSRGLITASGDGFSGEAVQRVVLRNERDPSADNDAMGMSGRQVTTRFTLPEGADPAAPLEALFASSVTAFDVWDGGRWVAVPCANVADNDDPWGGREDEALCPIPDGMVRDGELLLRIHTFDEAQYWPGALVGAAR